jgi:hypothetical protein
MLRALPPPRLPHQIIFVQVSSHSRPLASTPNHRSAFLQPHRLPSSSVPFVPEPSSPTRRVCLRAHRHQRRRLRITPSSLHNLLSLNWDQWRCIPSRLSPLSSTSTASPTIRAFPSISSNLIRSVLCTPDCPLPTARKDDAVSSVFCFVFRLVLQVLGIRLQIFSSNLKLTKKASRFFHLLHPEAIFSPHISYFAFRGKERVEGLWRESPQ